MPKNVMVQDAAGQVIGSTYLRRAKGLLKSGRAVLVDDHTIQLRASAQNAAAPDDKKEQNMEQEILFCAKAFYQKPETHCSLLTMSDASGDPMEVWELNGAAESAVITAQLQQLPLTDYVLRFAVVGSAEAESYAAPSLLQPIPKPTHWSRDIISRSIVGKRQMVHCCESMLCRCRRMRMER